MRELFTPPFLSLSILLGLLNIFIAYYFDFLRKEKNNQTKPYGWGYWFGCQGVSVSAVWVFWHIYAVLFGLPLSALAAFFFVYFAIQMICSFFILKRKRWAWVTGTTLSLNPLVWLINGIYIKNRWSELNLSSRASGDIKTPSLAQDGYAPSHASEEEITNETHSEAESSEEFLRRQTGILKKAGLLKKYEESIAKTDTINQSRPKLTEEQEHTRKVALIVFIFIGLLVMGDYIEAKTFSIFGSNYNFSEILGIGSFCIIGGVAIYIAYYIVPELIRYVQEVVSESINHLNKNGPKYKEYAEKILGWFLFAFAFFIFTKCEDSNSRVTDDEREDRIYRH